MTPEQRARMQETYDAYAAQKEGEPFTPLLDFIFLAGCRYQHAVTLERAAKVCEEWRRKHVLEECCDHAQHVALNSATAAIHALPFEDKP